MKFASVLLLSAVLLAGCATVPPPPPFTAPVADQTLPPPPPDKAQIVFIQAFKPIGIEQFTGIFEVRDTDRELLGGLTSRSRFVKVVAPGPHLFMSNGFGASFLRANVEAGKRYYVLSRFVAYVGYQLRPMRRSGPSDYNITIPDFQTWASLPLVDATPAGANFFVTQQTMFDRNYSAGWNSWQRKTDAERSELTLNPEDGAAL
jgi:hypothetical protein